MTFVMAKQRTLHVFTEQGKTLAVNLREREAGFAVYVSGEPVPVGMLVEACGMRTNAEPGTVVSCRGSAPHFEICVQLASRRPE
jgi:hypothetical protein